MLAHRQAMEITSDAIEAIEAVFGGGPIDWPPRFTIGSSLRREGMDLTLVTYCGLYCGLCSTICRTPKQAAALLETMLKDDWDLWGSESDKALIEKLRELAKIPESFTGCRGGKCGNPDCAIRKCAEERKIDVCVNCPDYPCERFDWLAKRYPTLFSDGKRMKEIGIEKWIEEQEDRRKTGACYADFRYPWR